MGSRNQGSSSKGNGAKAGHASQRQEKIASRIGVFDLLRGISVISMVLFHYCYDLRFLAGQDLSWFSPPLIDIWRASISWTFLLIAGCMCAQSKSNFKRAGRYGVVALLIYLVTYLAAVDVPISFGIIFCMAASTFIAALLKKLHLLPQGPVAAVLFFVLFLASRTIPQGSFGLGSHVVTVPDWLYQTEWLSWLGFPGPNFSSGDYYPVLPYTLLYLCGAAFGGWMTKKGYSSWARRAKVGPINFVGRHALAVYIIHQPVLLLLSGVVTL